MSIDAFLAINVRRFVAVARKLQDLERSSLPSMRILGRSTMLKSFAALAENAVEARHSLEEARMGAIGRAVEKAGVAGDHSTVVRRWQVSAKKVTEASKLGEWPWAPSRSKSTTRELRTGTRFATCRTSLPWIRRAWKWPQRTFLRT